MLIVIYSLTYLKFVQLSLPESRRFLAKAWFDGRLKNHELVITVVGTRWDQDDEL